MINDEFEEMTRTSVVARRNQLLGLWAGRRLGLSGTQLERYAIEVHDADFEVSGPKDVVDKVIRDLARADIAVGDATVTQFLAKAEADARRELLSTD